MKHPQMISNAAKQAKIERRKQRRTHARGYNNRNEPDDTEQSTLEQLEHELLESARR